MHPEWDKPLTLEESLTIQRELALRHLARTKNSHSGLVSFITNSQWGDVLSYELDYNSDVDDCREVRQALAFFSKFEPLPLGLDKEATAFKKFKESEDRCCETNRRLRRLRSANGLGLQSEIASILHGAQRKIASMLGPVPSYSKLNFSFGPGANTSVKASKSSPRWKLGADLVCSNELISSVDYLLSEAPNWAQLHCVSEDDTSYIVPVSTTCAKLQFVPKTAMTYRSICIEPILNSFAQKGIGGFLKGRLSRIGINLQDQTRNQTLACRGSVDNSLATVDLSAASDTISVEVVADLLPLDWFSFLSRFRTGRVEYSGEVLTLEKFSSMGNAFTFELETTLFWGLAIATCDFLQLPTENVSVYGDDVIIPKDAFPLLKLVFEHLGFVINTQKSFVDGPFRESCGADWLLGSDIRPFYQKTLVSAETLFILHNYYMRRFDLTLAAAVLEYIHPSLRIFGPDGYGDGHLIGSYSARRHRRASSHGYSGVLFDTFTHKARRNFAKSRGDWVLPAYSIYTSSHDDIVDHYTVRGTSGYKKISIYTHRLGIFF